MTKKSLRLLLLLCMSLIFALSVVVLAACDEDEDPYGFVLGQGNTVQVVLNSKLDPLIADKVDKITNGYMDYRLKPGSPIPEPGVTNGTSKPILEGYVFDGYYECKLALDGTVVYLSNEKWDFSKKVTEDVVLYGKWLVQYKIRVNFVVNGELTGGYEETYVTNNNATVTSIKEPSFDNHTYVQMYRDEKCTEPLNVSRNEPFEHGCTQENTVRDVYAKFIEGSWKLVRTASDLKSIGANVRLYLMNDIDMTDLNEGKTADGITSMTAPDSFGGLIEGNGYTISNLNYFREGKTGTSYTTYCIGLFAQLNGATIRNLTFENCSVGGSIRKINAEYFYGFLAGRTTSEECTFENVSLVNCVLKPIEFNVLGLTDPDAIQAEREKVEQHPFIGDGSYADAVQQTTATIKNLLSGGYILK